ncbi:hypothetical protein [Dactylosporangium sp. CA-139066]|uniref:hypothetical protein n=1 Tax=Dactylosporangium sp. CA-139066 TaxID=3239930 RepID=UPI003D9153CD
MREEGDRLTILFDDAGYCARSLRTVLNNNTVCTTDTGVVHRHRRGGIQVSAVRGLVEIDDRGATTATVVEASTRCGGSSVEDGGRGRHAVRRRST